MADAFLSHVRCGLCGSSERKILHRGDENLVLTEEDFSVSKSRMKKGEVSRCLACGLVYNSSPRTAPAIYTKVCDPGYEAEKNFRAKEFAGAFVQALSLDGVIPSKMNLLDVGCMTGIFMEHLKTAYPGISVSGVEPSVWAAEICRQKNLEVHCDRLENIELGSERFDGVTLFDVLEHVEDPRGVLKQVCRALKPGGFLLLTTPNIESLFYRLLGRRYWFIEAMHLYYFGPGTLAKLLHDTGFLPILRKRHFKYLGRRYFMERLRGLFPFWNGAVSEKTRPDQGGGIKIYAGQMLILARKPR